MPPEDKHSPDLPEAPLPPPRFVGSAEDAPRHNDRWMELVVAAAALVGRLPALGAWWHGEEWTLLGRAAGLVDESLPAAHWVGRHFFWDIFYPIFGLNPGPYAVIRLLLFAGCAWLVVRLARSLGLGSWQQLLAGMLVAATPLAFAALYQGAGVQDLLGLFLALLAVTRWLGGTRRGRLWAAALAVPAILSGVGALGLPLLFLAMLWANVRVRQENRAHAWSLIFLVSMVAIVEGLVVLTRSGSDPESLKLLPGLGAVATNSGVFGWWLLSPGPLLARDLSWPMTAAGLAFIAGWAWWAVVSWQHGRRLPGLTLLAAVLAVAPALPRVEGTAPEVLLPAVPALALAVSSLLTTQRKPGIPALVAVGFLVTAWSFWSMDMRLGQRDIQGLPDDPVVRSTSLSWKLCRQLLELPLNRGQREDPALTLLEIPRTPSDQELADKLGPHWVRGSELLESLGKDLGPRLVLARHLGRPVQVDWVNALFDNPPTALVLCQDGLRFRHWGDTPNATLVAALDDVAHQRYERARRHLQRGSRLQSGGAEAREAGSFFFDPDQLTVTPEQILAQKEPFIDWTAGLLAAGHSPVEVGGLQDVFLQLLVAVTGQTMEQLTAGSRTLTPAAEPSQPETQTGQ